MIHIFLWPNEQILLCSFLMKSPSHSLLLKLYSSLKALIYASFSTKSSPFSPRISNYFCLCTVSSTTCLSSCCVSYVTEPSFCYRVSSLRLKRSFLILSTTFTCLPNIYLLRALRALCTPSYAW